MCYLSDVCVAAVTCVSYCSDEDTEIKEESSDFPGGSDGKESVCKAGDLGSIPGLGRFPREENGYPLLYSCLENSMDREAWGTTVHGVKKSWTQLSN